MNMTTPISRLRDQRVTLAHGGGGKAMRDLIEEVFVAAFDPPGMEDQARLMTDALQVPGARLAFTTDSFVVTPIEFAGGDIGTLAVCGTVNDLAVGGATPLWLSASFIIEEGTEIALLRRIVASMVREAANAGVRIVTGDTKVVERGSADGVFVTTSGVGVIPPGRDLRAEARTLIAFASVDQTAVVDSEVVGGSVGIDGPVALIACAEDFTCSKVVHDKAGAVDVQCAAVR